jgi:hypothetical protein
MKVVINRDLNELARLLASVETGKKQIDIGQIKEILKLISIMISFDFELAVVLAEHGRKQSVRLRNQEKVRKLKK